MINPSTNQPTLKVNTNALKPITGLKPVENQDKKDFTERVPPHLKNISHDDVGFFRIWDIVGDKKRGIKAMIPIGRTTFLKKVKEGIYPAPVRIAEMTVAWKKSDIFALIAKLESGV